MSADAMSQIKMFMRPFVNLDNESVVNAGQAIMLLLAVRSDKTPREVGQAFADAAAAEFDDPTWTALSAEVRELITEATA